MKLTISGLRKYYNYCKLETIYFRIRNDASNEAYKRYKFYNKLKRYIILLLKRNSDKTIDIYAYFKKQIKFSGLSCFQIKTLRIRLECIKNDIINYEDYLLKRIENE